MIKVVNKRSHKSMPDEDVYIGRGSVLGNPFTHRDLGGTKAEFQVTSREEAIKQYRNWLLQRLNEKHPEIIKELNRIYARAKEGNINLVCYCKPAGCHGDVIKEFIDRALSGNNNGH